MKELIYRDNVEIAIGDQAVWINNGEGCLGRFGANGIDIHRTIEEQSAGQPQCLFCTHEPVGQADWPRFVAGMQEHHGVDISDIQAPSWLK